MLKTIKNLFTSKKFLMVILGSAIVAGMQYAGAPKEFIDTVALLFGTGVVGQGIADHGKEAAKEAMIK